MSKSTPLTLEDRKRLEELKDSSHSTREIARIMDRGEKLAQLEYSRAGGRFTYNAEKAHEIAQNRIDLRKLSNRTKESNISIRFTLQDRRQLESMKDLTISGSEIARIMRKHKNVINSEFRNNGGRKDYNAEAAQARWLKNHHERYEKFKRPMAEGGFVMRDEDLFPNLLTNPIHEYAAKLKEKNSEINLPPQEGTMNIHFPKLPLKIWVDRYKEEFSEGRKYWMKERRYFEFWIKYLGDQIATEIHPITIEALADKLTEREYKEGKFISESTRKKFLMYLSTLYTTAIEKWKWAVFNPVTCVRKTDKRKEKLSHNTTESIGQLVQLKKDFVDMVKQKARELGLAQREAARKCGISLNCWQHGMNPEKNTLLKNFVMICNGFGIKISLIDESGLLT